LQMGRFGNKTPKFLLNFAPERGLNTGGILPIQPLTGSLFMPLLTRQDPFC
jgi:hypothetical protein